jgi:hypothetical protein
MAQPGESVVAEWSDDRVRAIWKRFCNGAQYSWRLGAAAETTLAKLVAPGDLTRIMGRNDAFARREALKIALRPALTGHEAHKREEAAAWIIREWGGIRRLGEGTLRCWLDRLGRFQPECISAFIDAEGMLRISSWSKLLAFASDDYAIYDARVALACTLALRDNGIRDAFFPIPAGRNRVVAAALARLPTTGRPLSYRDYLTLLRRFVAGRLAPSIAAAEAHIFANAVPMAAGAGRPEPTPLERRAPDGWQECPLGNAKVVFPHAGNHSVSLDSFLRCWASWPTGTMASRTLPRLAQMASADDLKLNDRGHGLDAMCRTMVPAQFRNTMQASRRFMEANAELLRAVTCENPVTGRQVAGASLSDAAWERLRQLADD